MQEITKKQKCLILRNSIEIWLDEEKWTNLENRLNNSIGKFYAIEGRMINAADIVGLFLPVDLEEMKLRKNGKWKCDYGVWHSKGQECFCFEAKERERQKREMQERMAVEEISEEEKMRGLQRLNEMKKDIFK